MGKTKEKRETSKVQPEPFNRQAIKDDLMKEIVVAHIRLLEKYGLPVHTFGEHNLTQWAEEHNYWAVVQMDKYGKNAAYYDETLPMYTICQALLHELVHFLTGNYLCEGYTCGGKSATAEAIEKATDNEAYELFSSLMLSTITSMSRSLFNKWSVPRLDDLKNSDWLNNGKSAHRRENLLCASGDNTVRGIH